MQRKNGKHRWNSRLLLPALVLAAASLFNAVSQDAASAGPPAKVVVCHATASDANPWVRIEVSANAVPVHLGLVDKSHKHQQSLGRYDFVWTPAYNEACVLVPDLVDPITVQCSGISETPEPVQAVADNGAITVIPCPATHAEVDLPPGVHRIICAQGTVGAPYPQAYQLVPNGLWYSVNCLLGDTVDLGIQGGRLQVVCPAEGSVSFYRFIAGQGIVAVPRTCTPGDVAPTPQNPLGAFTDSIDWSLYAGQDGMVKCPANGPLQVYFLGEGLPVSTTSAMTPYTCIAGSKVDVTRLVPPA